MEIRVVCPLCKKDLSKKEFLQIHKDTNYDEWHKKCREVMLYFIQEAIQLQLRN